MENREKIMLKVSYVSIIGNLFLTIFKLLAGFIGHSVAMVSDGVHSFSDIASTVIVIIGVKLGNRSSDKEHQYGHERMESAMSIVLAVLLFFVGIEIGESGIKNIFFSESEEIIVPSMIAIIAAVVSIITKEGMFWVTYLASKKVKSSMLKADAWHHRSDAISSVVSLIGIFLAQKGYVWFDSVAGLLIGLFITKISIDIFREALDKMVDKACSEEEQKKISDAILSVEGVINVDGLRTRLFGDKIFVDVEILVNGDITVSQGHIIAGKVREKVKNTLEEIKDCHVHVNPYCFE